MGGYKKIKAAATNFPSYYEAGRSRNLTRRRQTHLATFAKHLARIFTPNIREVNSEKETGVFDRLKSTKQRAK
jgi:hypothetical protein